MVEGTVVDVLTLQPVAGAWVSLEPLGRRVLTTHRGHFRLYAPPGRYTVYIDVKGYVGARLVNIEITGRRRDLGQIELVPVNLPVQDEMRLYEKVVKQPQVEPPPPAVLEDPQLKVAAVDIPSTIKVRWPDGREELVNLDEYLKGVVPSEVPASWPTEALKAQAVAARSYAIAYFKAYGYICTTTSCQVYNPNYRWATTDAAVDATSGVVAAYNDSVIWAFFFSRCNGSYTLASEHAINWQTCQEAPWPYVPYCRSRPCWGHNPYASSCVGPGVGFFGHGVGMCQWGAWARAKEGFLYSNIIKNYYTGVTVNSPGNPPPAPQALSQPARLIGLPITLTWSGAAESFKVELWNKAGTFLTSSGWLSGNQWSVDGLAADSYYWRVRGGTAAAGEGNWSNVQAVTVLPIAARLYLPQIKSGTGAAGW